MALIPPGTGMAHQVSLEYLSRVVFEDEALLFPDSVVGTDSHITMVNGLGILGWGEYTACILFSWAGTSGIKGHQQQVAGAWRPFSILAAGQEGLARCAGQCVVRED